MQKNLSLRDFNWRSRLIQCSRADFEILRIFLENCRAKFQVRWGNFIMQRFQSKTAFSSYSNQVICCTTPLPKNIFRRIQQVKFKSKQRLGHAKAPYVKDNFATRRMSNPSRSSHRPKMAEKGGRVTNIRQPPHFLIIPWKWPRKLKRARILIFLRRRPSHTEAVAVVSMSPTSWKPC